MQRRKSDNFNTLVITSAQRKVEVQFHFWACLFWRPAGTGCRYHIWFMTGSSVALSSTLSSRHYLAQQLPLGFYIFFKEIFNSSCKKTAHKHGFTTASAGPHMYNYIRVHTNHQTLSRTQTDAHKHKKSYLWVWFLHTQINARVAKKMMARSLRLLWRNTPTSLLSLCVLAHPWPPKAAWGLQFYGLNRVSLCLLFAPNPAECLRWTSTILHS